MKIVHRRDYREARAAEYPPLGDQLDALMKYFAAMPDIPEGLGKWIDACQAVKEKYPKPEA